MKIEAGKRYVRRDGEISGVIGVVDRPAWAEYTFSDGYLTYRQDGVYDQWTGVCVDDLISEYIEPKSETVINPETITFVKLHRGFGTKDDYQRGINDAVKWFNARNPHLLINITAELIEKDLNND